MKRILIMLLAAFLVLSFVGCSEKEEEEKKESVDYEEKMAESVSVDSTQIITDGEEGASKVSAVVTLPDFDSFFNECINETKERAKSDEDFNKKLLRALYQKTRRSESSVTKEYEIDLTKAGAETEEWSEADIEEYIKKYAIEKEIEAYCMKVVLLEAPDIEE
ncbi:MAG: hypothetical protein IJ323_01240 [Clostridia bacterium]|nr:hypothetical protein [Clostridia bacterium]